jgi:hypothetical protein
MPLTPQALLAAVGRRPFVPFCLMMQVGQPIEVGRPDLVLVGRFSCIVGRAAAPEQPYYDHCTGLVHYTHVKALEFLEAPPVPRQKE